MNCAYHSVNAAVVNCNGCGKPFCPACDHRIKGFPFCQDCIVAGVEMLRNRGNGASYVPLVKKQTSPFLALDSFIYLSRTRCGLQWSNFQSPSLFCNFYRTFSDGNFDQRNASFCFRFYGNVAFCRSRFVANCPLDSFRRNPRRRRRHHRPKIFG